MTKIVFRVILEVLGKPQVHVEEALKGYLKQIHEDSRYKIITQELAPTKQQEGQEMWTTFAELELETKEIKNVVNFCFDYMPSLVEIVEPEELTLTDVQATEFFSDLQGKLHHVDMVAKKTKLENDHLQRNMSLLLKNYILVLLTQNNLSSEQIAKLTGVSKDKIEDFLDKLIDEKKVDLKEGVYFIIRENGNK
jgi:predicted XRE-type DNA-binding protein